MNADSQHPTLVPVVDGFAGAVGQTPLIRLRRASEATGCEILGKAEFMNPGGSVKDRAALGIVEDAERRGQLVPGEPGTVVEGTAGNTSIGIALYELDHALPYWIAGAGCALLTAHTNADQAVGGVPRRHRPFRFRRRYALAPATAKGRVVPFVVRSAAAGRSRAPARCAKTVLYQVRY
mgnify:CR=1 FL=1